MPDFDWRAEDDPLLPAEPPSPERAAGRRRWPLFLLVLIVAAGVALVQGYRRVQRQVETNLDRLEQDVRASHRLVRDAAANADREVFIRVLSGSEPEWATYQEAQIAQGQWLDRPALGLLWQPYETVSTTVDLSADLQEAVVTSREWYTRTLPGGGMQAVALRQTAVYRPGPDHWLYAPPRPEFWGEAREIDGDYLRLAYAERDEALVRRLLPDLDALLARLCANDGGLACPAGFRIIAVVETDPARISDWDVLEPSSYIEPAVPLVRLPSPTLLGEPVDEAAYSLFYETYAVALLTSASIQVVGPKLLQTLPLFQALLAREMPALGLTLWDGYATAPAELALTEQQVLEELVIDLWREEPATPGSQEWQMAARLVDFLLTADPPLAPPALLQLLADANNYQHLLRERAIPDIKDVWLDYLYAKAYPAVEGVRPSSGPLLLCEPGAYQRLLRYDPGSGRLEDALPELTFFTESEQTSMIPYPGGGLLLLNEEVWSAGRQTYVYLWEGEEAELIWASGEHTRYHYRLLDVSPDGRYLSLEQWSALTETGRERADYWVADIARCRQGDCLWYHLNLPPIWSPDGRRALFHQPENMGLFLGGPTAENVEPAGFGASPFWLDAQTYAYWQYTPAGTLRALVSQQSGESEPQELLAMDRLEDLLGDFVDPLTITPAVAQEPQMILYLLPSVPGRNRVPLVQYRPGSGGLSVVNWALLAQRDSLSVAPSGQRLAISTHDGALIYNWRSGEQQLFPTARPYPQLAWSPDGEWLSAVTNERLLLISPGQEQVHSIEPARRPCTALVWN